MEDAPVPSSPLAAIILELPGARNLGEVDRKAVVLVEDGRARQKTKAVQV